MHWAVEARVAREFAAPARLERQPILRAVWRIASAPLVTLSYLGILGATLMIGATPFNIVGVMAPAHSRHPPWTLVTICFAWSPLLCLVLAFGIYRGLRVRCVDVDFVVAFLGSLLAFWYLALVAFSNA